MADELVSALLRAEGLRVVLVLTGELSRRARELAGMRPGSASLLSQGLTAGLLLAALQKERTRLNLQLECDGPLRGLFVDASSSGEVRGYVKNPLVEHIGGEGEFRWRPVLGNTGFLSVLRDQGGGEYYRSSVQLARFDLAADLESFFADSEQIRTEVMLGAVAEGDEPLAVVGGLLLQPLPDGDVEALAAHGARLEAPGVFGAGLQTGARSGAAAAVKALFPGSELEVLARYPVEFRCSCSKERVKNALLAMGRAELDDLLAKDGQAEVTCQFCSTRYTVSGEEIRRLLEAGRGS
ncbi:MAG TPA: Hsp33 family molecular chaperone HslO [Myxococcales bacterium]|nr:Hsp33 family molecular chaperone HslO [Myxococcales bacterium]